MKKLLLVLACAASLGLWMSCENESQELDVTLHSGLIKDSYTNYGTAKATKVTMVTKNTNIKVTYTEDDYNPIPNNMPKDNKGYYIGTVETLKTESDVTSVERTSYWFYNEWDSGTQVEFDYALITWSGDVSYTTGSPSTSENNIVGNNKVSNGKTYRLSLSKENDKDELYKDYSLLASGGTVKITNGNYGTASFAMTGSLEGNFAINASLKELDERYEYYLKPADIRSGQRFDERTTYDYEFNYTNGEREYVATKIPADTSVYYLKDVSFTKN
ncbi:MAG: hypothetical protein HDR32_04605 [Treponema sp.]|nr:hypothetical protein [Treponema sp.]